MYTTAQSNTLLYRHTCFILCWIYILAPSRRYPLQPGCWTIICAHSRAYEYYAETVIPGNEMNLLATRCSSYTSFKSGKCASKSIPMGINTPTNARGNYYLKTNKQSPFGTKRFMKQLARQLALF